jgi:hypothetical protein
MNRRRNGHERRILEDHSGIVQKFLFGLVILLFALLAGAARCWNIQDVFHDHQIYFTEADAYSRMTRVRLIAEGKGPVIRHHDFENWPAGTTPHTTAPMDWTILAIRPLVSASFAAADPSNTSVLRAEALDFAGAMAGPLLGMLTCFALAVSLPKRDARERWLVAGAVLVFAISPILVHGTLLGRPDHQALLIFLLAIALAAEVRLLREATKPWSIVAGVAWGLALWTSLYEPLILLAVTFAGMAISDPSSFRERVRRWEWGTLAVIMLIGILIDGWRIQLPDADLREAFRRWSGQIGEMQALSWKSNVIKNWVGWLFVAAPFLLIWQWKTRHETRLALVWLVAAFALTWWQVRWGYFFALVFAVTLPLVLNPLRRAWIQWIAYFASIWPVLGDWDRRLFPDDAELRRRYVLRQEDKALRQIAEIQRERKAGPFVAPWWLSPRLAYWSHQPGVAGSSHESLPGIIDTARIYLAPNDEAALTILRQRRVTWLISDAPERIVPNSASLLGVAPPEKCLASKLAQVAEMPPSTSPFVEPRPIRNPFFQVWRVPAEGEPAVIKP